MEGSRTLSNPFPGLRPFEADEEHLFFGREQEVDELLRRLRTTRFLLVAGSSGTGKSSLVRSGLIPALESGFMLQAGSSWRIIIFRPGDNPIGNLAAAMDAPNALGTEGDLASTNRVLLEATLQRSSLGIVQAVRQARIPAHDNVLIVVDQFEELFRFRRSGRNSRDEAVAFFKLLLEATRQQDIPVYIALTMRSDFLGDCIEFQGLPEAASDGVYLIPRMTRDELRSAITGPIAVAGAAITPRLVQRLLNDLGDDQDQLPVLQHALMRTWDHWEPRRAEERAIDIADYEAIGGLEKALSLHAEEAFGEAASVEHGQQIAEKAFRALTDTYSDPRGVRRASSIQELAAVCQVPESGVTGVTEIFRRAGRSFLTPPDGVRLESHTMVDLSHESLMRCWTRLMAWTNEERESAASYMRIAQAALWWSESSGSLWTDPQLEIGLQWRSKNRPTAAWAERYDSKFALAMEFLDRSAERREAERQKEIARRRRSQIIIWALSALSLLVGTLGILAYEQEKLAADNLKLADQNFTLARRAVGDFLSSAGAHRAQEFPDSPDLEEFRGQLLDKAKIYYQKLAAQAQGGEKVEAEMAMANANLGDIDRLRQKNQDAVNEYSQAIHQYQNLSQNHPANADYRENLAYSYMWLGETLRRWLESSTRPAQYTNADARNAYDHAIAIQQRLHEESPVDRIYQQELGRSYYNRAILLSEDHADPEPDFLHAIALLKPLAPDNRPTSSQMAGDLDPALDLSRVENNLGAFYLKQNKFEQADNQFRQAILDIARLQKKYPTNSEDKADAGYYYNNLAQALSCEGRMAEAKKANDTARELIEEVDKPNPALDDLRAKIAQWGNYLDTQ
jgi:tetratricopeptide (TPR) repeat protein